MVLQAFPIKLMRVNNKGNHIRQETITMADKILHKIYVYKRRYIRWRASIEKRRYQAIRVARSGFDI